MANPVHTGFADLIAALKSIFGGSSPHRPGKRSKSARRRGRQVSTGSTRRLSARDRNRRRRG